MPDTAPPLTPPAPLPNKGTPPLLPPVLSPPQSPTPEQARAPDGKSELKKQKLDPADSSGADNPNAEDDEPGQSHGPSLKLPIALGLLSAALVVAIVLMAAQIFDRNTTISGNKNRMDQLQFETDKLLKQVETDKGAMAKVEEDAAFIKAEAAVDKLALDKAKAEAAELQLEAEKLRAKATDFETKMTEAQVASIKHQGEVEFAEAKTKVASTQLNNALAETQKLNSQLSSARTERAELQLQLDETRKQLALFQKPNIPPRK